MEAEKKVNGEKNHLEKIKIGKTYKLAKIFIKKGKKSGIPVGLRKIKIARLPIVGLPLIGSYTSEHGISKQPKEVTYECSSNVVGFKNINDLGLVIETQTSVLLLKEI